MITGIDFQHVILTRFNLATPGREAAIRNRHGWLARRFDLFERYCLPSVAAQTCRDFRWLIYFDEHTPQEFRDRIEAARAVQPFTPIFSGLFRSEGWPRTVRETVGDRVSALVSTRLDNDDCLAADFVARLHARLAGPPLPERAALNFTHGYVLQQGRLYALRHRSNAFAPLVEPFDGRARTVADIKHMELARACPVVQVPGPGAWLQVVHGENVSNKARGRRVGPAELRGRFPAGIVDGLPTPDRVEMALENALIGPVRAARDLASELRHALGRRG